MAPPQAIPKDFLITKEWSKEYKSDNIFQEMDEHLSSKSAFHNGIYSEYLLDNGKMWMNGKLCVPNRWASTVVHWWQKWQAPYSHGAKPRKSIQHHLF